MVDDLLYLVFQIPLEANFRIILCQFFEDEV